MHSYIIIKIRHKADSVKHDEPSATFIDHSKEATVLLTTTTEHI